jgi:type I restriction enzyme R subunit
MEKAGYSGEDIERIDEKVKFYIDLRDEIRHASGETLDLKSYEADMRHLIDNYIQADSSKVIGNFEEMPLLDVIVNSGIAEAKQKLPKNIRNNKDAVAETIENNVRQKIIKDELTDPAFYEKMSKLLDDLVKERKSEAVNYEKYLQQIADIAKQVQSGREEETPESLQTAGQLALYNNLDEDEDLALACDKAVKYNKKADWRGNPPAEKEIKYALYEVLNDKEKVERIFPIIKNQSEY